MIALVNLRIKGITAKEFVELQTQLDEWANVWRTSEYSILTQPETETQQTLIESKPESKTK